MQAINREPLARRAIMEHRWGERVALGLPVHLELAGELLARGRLCNASISGGYVVTDTKLPLLAVVDVVLRSSAVPDGRLLLPACVVRRDEGGLGLEWRDMACESVIAMLREAAVQAPLWRRDRAFG